jgi:D-alanyl-D-alanine carboxypeptidase/D-alanyl-D-alanine-endopeptidase (penicillin-binding protein 4)
LAQIIAKLLEYSNNFIANQILIALGATRYDPPGTLDKGVQAVLAYLKTELGITDISLVEGSGISRKNRISAKKMLKILKKFESYHFLMRSEGVEFYKTGRLYGVSARAGYIRNNKGELYRFVIFINTPGKSFDPVMKKFRALVSSFPG